MRTISTFVLALLVFSFLFLSLPHKGNSQELGCCFEPDANSCSGCEGLACAISLENCQRNFPNSLFSEDSYCIEGGCSNNTSAGCCVIQGGDCKEVASLNTCELGEGGIAYFVGVGCNQVPSCSNSSPPGGSEVSNVPTLSEWGLIAMAGILGIIGFLVVRRRQARA